MLYLINHQPWIDLDPFIDVRKFSTLLDSLYLGVAKSQGGLKVGRIGLQQNQFDQTRTEMSEQAEDARTNPAHPDHALLKDLPINEALVFMKYKYGYEYLGSSLNLREIGTTYFEKHLSSATRDTEWYEFFQPFKHWLHNESGIFKEIGRTMLFVSERHSPTPIHTDLAPGSRKDQFIWVNPAMLKRFFVYDEKTDTRHHITSMFSVFDNASFHGGEPTDRSTFSIRVDGLFSDEFLARSGLSAHYASQE